MASGSARLGSVFHFSARIGSVGLGSAQIGSGKLGPSRLGSARLGLARARLGSARLGLGSARLASARLGSARPGPARLGSARLGPARLGPARPGRGGVLLTLRGANQSQRESLIYNRDFCWGFNPVNFPPPMLRGRCQREPAICYIKLCVVATLRVLSCSQMETEP